MFGKTVRWSAPPAVEDVDSEAEDTRPPVDDDDDDDNDNALPRSPAPASPLLDDFHLPVPTISDIDIDAITSRSPMVTSTTTSSPPKPEKKAEKKAEKKDEKKTDDKKDEKKELALELPDGMRRVVEYYTNEKGQHVKVTRLLRKVRKVVSVNRSVAARRQWAKFGDCEGLPPGPEPNITTKSHELIHLNLDPRAKDPLLEPDPLEKLVKTEGKSLVYCHNCGDPGHWTLRCPKPVTRSTAELLSSSAYPDRDDRDDRDGRDGRDDDLAKKPNPAPPPKPPTDAKSDDATEENPPTLRVTNLSEDATEDDLRELFGRFGYISRLYLAKDRETRRSRGFAFITYSSREDAQRSKDKLDKHPYDKLILAVDWALPAKPSGGTAADGNNKKFGKFGAGPSRRGGRGALRHRPNSQQQQRSRLQLLPKTKK